mgnify:CR=1 FL=1
MILLAGGLGRGKLRKVNRRLPNDVWQPLFLDGLNATFVGIGIDCFGAFDGLHGTTDGCGSDATGAG